MLGPRLPWIAAGLALVLTTIRLDFGEPPRFDGTGYAILAVSLLEGRGYREINQPGAPVHDHFPPGYPLALAGLWSLTGVSTAWARLGSALATVAAVWLWTRWLSRRYPGPLVGPLALGVAANWTWVANGGAIRSEPLFLAWTMLALILHDRIDHAASTKTMLGWSVALGACLGAATLTRHVGAATLLALAVSPLVPLAFPTTRSETGWSLRLRLARSGLILTTAGLLLLPWILWVLGTRRAPQAARLGGGDQGLLDLFWNQALFYAVRIPDTLTAPVLEVATVFSGRPTLAMAATLLGVALTSVTLLGMFDLIRRPATRPAGMVLVLTLAVLLIWPYTEAGRFLVPLVPALGLATWRGSLVLGSRIGRRLPPATHRRRLLRRVSLALAAVVGLATLPYTLHTLIANRSAALRATQAPFEAACAWLKEHVDPREGPILARHGGDVYWRTGIPCVEPDPDHFDEQVDAHRITWILIESSQFARQEAHPLLALIQADPERFEEVERWPREGRQDAPLVRVVRINSSKPSTIDVEGPPP